MSKPTATDRFLEHRLAGHTFDESRAMAGLSGGIDVETQRFLSCLEDLIDSRIHEEDVQWLESAIEDWTQKLKDLKRMRKAVYWLRERKM